MISANPLPPSSPPVAPVQLVEEVKAAGNIILFFDEIHQILGTGATGGEDGGKGLADIIKPALSRGELSVRLHSARHVTKQV